MKTIVLVLLMFVCISSASAQTGDASGSYAGYVAPLDTLVAADTAIHTMVITGSKSAIAIQVDVTKIGATTIAGTLNLYGSINGVTYLTAPIASAVTVGNASANYAFTLTNNPYKKIKLIILGSGSGTASYRPYLLYRK